MKITTLQLQGKETYYSSVNCQTDCLGVYEFWYEMAPRVSSPENKYFQCHKCLTVNLLSIPVTDSIFVASVDELLAVSCTMIYHSHAPT